MKCRVRTPPWNATKSAWHLAEIKINLAADYDGSYSPMHTYVANLYIISYP